MFAVSNTTEKEHEPNSSMNPSPPENSENSADEIAELIKLEWDDGDTTEKKNSPLPQPPLETSAPGKDTSTNSSSQPSTSNDFFEIISSSDDDGGDLEAFYKTHNYNKNHHQGKKPRTNQNERMKFTAPKCHQPPYIVDGKVIDKNMMDMEPSELKTVTDFYERKTLAALKKKAKERKAASATGTHQHLNGHDESMKVHSKKRHVCNKHKSPTKEWTIVPNGNDAGPSTKMKLKLLDAPSTSNPENRISSRKRPRLRITRSPSFALGAPEPENIERAIFGEIEKHDFAAEKQMADAIIDEYLNKYKNGTNIEKKPMNLEHGIAMPPVPEITTNYILDAAPLDLQRRGTPTFPLGASKEDLASDEETRIVNKIEKELFPNHYLNPLHQPAARDWNQGYRIPPNPIPDDDSSDDEEVIRINNFNTETVDHGAGQELKPPAAIRYIEAPINNFWLGQPPRAPLTDKNETALYQPPPPYTGHTIKDLTAQPMDLGQRGVNTGQELKPPAAIRYIEAPINNFWLKQPPRAPLTVKNETDGLFRPHLIPRNITATQGLIQPPNVPALGLEERGLFFKIENERNQELRQPPPPAAFNLEPRERLSPSKKRKRTNKEDKPDIPIPMDHYFYLGQPPPPLPVVGEPALVTNQRDQELRRRPTPIMLRRTLGIPDVPPHQNPVPYPAHLNPQDRHVRRLQARLLEMTRALRRHNPELNGGERIGVNERDVLAGNQMVDQVPCEFCNKMFRFDEIMNHQVNCIPIINKVPLPRGLVDPAAHANLRLPKPPDVPQHLPNANNPVLVPADPVAPYWGAARPPPRPNVFNIPMALNGNLLLPVGLPRLLNRQDLNFMRYRRAHNLVIMGDNFTFREPENEVINVEEEENFLERHEIPENFDLLSPIDSLRCRCIKIGSYSVHPLKTKYFCKVHLRQDYIAFSARSISDPQKDLLIRLFDRDILEIQAHFGRGLPVMFVYTTVEFAAKLRNVLNMNDNSNFDPPSNNEQVNKLIFPIKNLSAKHSQFLKTCFPGELKIREIDQEAANEILVKSTTQEELENFLPSKEGETIYQSLLGLEEMNLVTNVEKFECPICFSDIDEGEGVVLQECLHSFCRECLAGVIKHCTNAEVKCPYKDESYSCDCALLEREIKFLVSPDVYERYLKKSVDLAESQAGNSFHCKTPNCPGWCLFEDEINSFNCPACRSKNCLTCSAIHEGQNCRQYQDYVKLFGDSDEEVKKSKNFLSDMLKAGNAMQCPTCNIIIIKKEGCDYLVCSMCKTEICWVTRGPRWGPKGRGDRSGGCHCGERGKRCHPNCRYCH